MDASPKVLKNYYHIKSSDLSILNGESDFYDQYQKFLIQIKEQGIRDTLTSNIDVLLPGISVAAFHGIIRLAYGIEAKNKEEIASGLAYWKTSYQTFDGLNLETDKDLLTILKQLRELLPKNKESAGLISQQMEKVCRHSGIIDTPAQSRLLSLNSLAEITLAMYLSHNNFTLLHGVTGCHALRMIWPFINDKKAALSMFWQAYILAFLSTGFSVILP